MCYFPWSPSLGSFSRPIACGQCIGCRLEKSRQWAVRCVHEASLNKHNVFVTLTYNDANLPEDGSLRYRDFQLFMKKLRRTGRSVRFYMCGEYGEENLRPHYHAILFGCWFPDMKYWRMSGAGFRLYRSAELELLWPLGNCEIGMVSFESAAYVARYVLKKVTGDDAAKHYGVREPEFARMSLKPGVGGLWFEKFGKSDVVSDGKIVANGVKGAAPRYYREKIRGKYPFKARVLAAAGHERLIESIADNGPSRLTAKEVVKRAALSKLRRDV